MDKNVIEDDKGLLEEVCESKTPDGRATAMERLNQLTAANGDELAPVFEEAAVVAMARVQTLVFAERFGYLSRTLSMANVARTYFGKSTAWMSQKLNGHVKNGKPVTFTPEELGTLKDAIKDIARRLTDAADSL